MNIYYAAYLRPRYVLKLCRSQCLPSIMFYDMTFNHHRNNLRSNYHHVQYYQKLSNSQIKISKSRKSNDVRKYWIKRAEYQRLSKQIMLCNSAEEILQHVDNSRKKKESFK